MASPFANFSDAFWNFEWRCVGVWNAILNQYFPSQQKWIVGPEGYPCPDDTQGLMADLVVSPVVQVQGLQWTTANPILTLEGKGRTPTDNYDVIQTQMLAWCRRGLANNNNAVSQFSCWAVGVSGYFVKFYAFDPLNPSSDGTQGQLVRLGIDRDPTTGAPNICKCERLAQVITTDPKWADVQAMMELISQRPIIDSAYIQALPARRPTGMDIE
jgi:hypothetical protein